MIGNFRWLANAAPCPQTGTREPCGTSPARPRCVMTRPTCVRYAQAVEDPVHNPAGDSAGSTDSGGRLASVQSHSDRKWRSAAPSAGAHVETPSSVGYMTPAGFVVWPRPSTWPSSCSRTGPALSYWKPAHIDRTGNPLFRLAIQENPVADAVSEVWSWPATSATNGGSSRLSAPAGRW